MKKVQSNLWVLLCLFVISCGSEDNEPVDDFDRTVLLNNVANNLILPTYESFANQTTALDNAANAFVANQEAANLTVLKDAWIDAKLTWKEAEAFNFGPVDILSVETSINLWPTSTQGVEAAVSSYNGNSEYLESIGSDKKGLPAIEYLLFHKEESTILLEFKNANRTAYLLLLTNTLKQQASSLRGLWASGYKDTFVENIGNEADASITLLGNELIFNVENLANAAIGEPLGLLDGADPNPAKLESFYALLSKEMIESNLVFLQKTFNGGDGIGFDDYLSNFLLDSDQEPLEVAINNQFDVIHQDLSELPGTVEDAFISNPAQMESIYTEMKKLLVLLKSDMTSRLNLLVVFNDNDGD